MKNRPGNLKWATTCVLSLSMVLATIGVHGMLIDSANAKAKNPVVAMETTMGKITIELFADNLARYRAGAPLLGIVDFEKGY